MLYDICCTQFPQLIKMADYFIDRNKHDYDNQVTIEGGTGSGKSMFTLILILIIYHKLHRVFKIEKQTLFIPDEGELKKEIDSLKTGDIYWIDEAIRALDKHFWYKIDQIELNQMVKTDTRRKKLSLLYNIQRFREINESFRNHNIQSRIYIIKRFAAVMFLIDDDKDIDDPWHTKENLSFKQTKLKEYNTTQVLMTPNERYDIETSLPNYFLSSQYPDITQIPELSEYWDYYEVLKAESRITANVKALEKSQSKPMTMADKRATIRLMRYAKMMVDEHPDLSSKEVYNKFIKPYNLMGKHTFSDALNEETHKKVSAIFETQ